jgi:hypothetical protein
LPEVNETNCPVGTRLKKHINELRMGLQPDVHGWLESCENSGIELFLEQEMGMVA